MSAAIAIPISAAAVAPIKIPSPARIAANRANSLKSCGPKTPEGKERSRRNALKHGMAGAGVALPEEDAAEVEARFADLHAQFGPKTPMGAILVRRVALTSLRMERAAGQEAAHLSGKIRHAVADHDLQRQLEVARLLAGLDDDPAAAVRRLLRTPEGTEALIASWLGLRDDLGRHRRNPRFWTAAHRERANLLTGRRVDEVPVSRVDELSDAIRGDFGLIGPDEGAGLDDEDRRDWARHALVALIDEEVAALRNCFDSLDHEAFALDRDEAPGRALFDDSRGATLARRYEADAERGMFRALRELRKVEREAAEAPPVPQACQAVPSASFGAEAGGSPGRVDRPRLDRRSGPADAPGWPVDEATSGSIGAETRGRDASPGSPRD